MSSSLVLLYYSYSIHNTRQLFRSANERCWQDCITLEINEWLWNTGGMMLTGKREIIWEKPASVTLRPPQIPYGLATYTRFSGEKSTTVWAMLRPWLQSPTGPMKRLWLQWRTPTAWVIAQTRLQLYYHRLIHGNSLDIVLYANRQCLCKTLAKVLYTNSLSHGTHLAAELYSNRLSYGKTLAKVLYTNRLSHGTVLATVH
jgi:hypothetical protein